MKSIRFLTRLLSITCLIGLIAVPFGTLYASNAANFTNNGAPTNEVGPGDTNIMVLDVTIPDGTNGAAEDTLLLDNGASIWSGDTLIGMTANEWYFDDNGNTNWDNGSEAIWVDSNADSMIQSGEIQEYGLADLEAFTTVSGTTQGELFFDVNTSGDFESGEAIFLDANSDSTLGPADDVAVGLLPGAMLRDGVAGVMNFNNAIANPGSCGTGTGCHCDAGINDILFCDGVGGGPADGLYTVGESIFIDMVGSPTPADYDPGVDYMIADYGTIYTGATSCTAAGGAPLPLTAGGSHNVVFLDANGDGCYDTNGAGSLPPLGGPALPFEPVVNLSAPLADGAPLIASGPSANYQGFASATPDVSIASPEWDPTGMLTAPMTMSNGGDLKFIGLNAGVGNDSYQGEAIVDDDNSNSIFESGELLADDVATRGGPGQVTRNFAPQTAHSGSGTFDSSESIYDESTGSTALTLEKKADMLTGIGVVNGPGTAVDPTDISQVQVWEDGPSAGFDGDEVNLGSMTRHSTLQDEWRLSGLTLPVNAGGKRIFVTADITGAPTNGATMQFVLPPYNDAGGDNVANSDGDLGAFMASINDGPMDGPVMNANTQTIDSLVNITDANISILSNGTGTLGTEEYIIGDTIVVQWDDSGAGDNNGDIVGNPTVDFSSFGGGAAVAMEDDGAGGNCNDGGAGDDVYCAAYTIVAGAVDSAGANNLNVSVSATDDQGNSATTADSTGLDCDNIAPAVTDSNISIAGGSGTGGAYIVGDTVTVTWDAATDGTGDVASATADLSGWGGGAAMAMTDTTACNGTNADNVWEACYTITGGEGIDGSGIDATVSVTDDAGNSTGPVADTTGATVDAIAPVLNTSGLSISLDGGVAGVAALNGGAVPADQITVNASVAVADGDTITWDGTGLGGVINQANGSTVTLAAGLIDNPTMPIDISATDNAGNTDSGLSTAIDGSSLSIDNIAPTIGTPGNVSLTTDNGGEGVASVGDTITYASGAPGAADGDNWTVDFSPFGGLATQAPGAWVIVADNDDGAFTATESIVDNAGNLTTGAASIVGFTNIDNENPVVTVGNITTTGGSGGAGAFIVGDTVTVTWDAASDGTTDVATAVADLSAFGGGASVNMTDTAACSGIPGDNVWEACYTITGAEGIDSTTANATVFVTDDANNTTGPVADAAVTIDTIVPVVTDANISIAGGNGTGGAYIVGDTVTVTWDAATDGTGDVGSASADLSGWGGGAATAMTDTAACGGTLGDNVWEACYTITGAEGIDAGGVNATVSVLDDAGNGTGPVADTTGAVVDTIAPTIGTPGVIAITLDNNSNTWANVNDTVSYTDAVPGAADGDTFTVDLTGLTGNAAAASAGNPHTVIAGALNGSTNFTETVTDDAGNTVTGPTNSINVNNIATGALTATNVQPASLTTNATGTATVDFTTVAAIPADGTVEVVFGAGFDLSGVGATDGSCSIMDGTVATSVSGQTVTITRQNDGTPLAGATAETCSINNVKNPGTAGSTGTYTIRTTDSLLNPLDEDNAVTADTISAPAGGGGGGGGGSAGGSSVIFSSSTTDEESTDEETVEEETTGEEEATDEESAEEASDEETTSETAFSDMDGHWSADYVNQVYTDGYIEGYEDGTFKPDQSITRSEASKLIALWMNSNAADEACDPALFDDVDCEDWYGSYVTYLYLQGIIEGYDNGDFGPGMDISRAEALKILIFAKELQDTDLSDILNPFSDVSATDWFYDVVMIGYKLSIVEGYDDGTFGPNQPVTRAEFTKMFVETLLNN